MAGLPNVCAVLYIFWVITGITLWITLVDLRQFGRLLCIVNFFPKEENETTTTNKNNNNQTTKNQPS